MKKRYSGPQIVAKLREADRLLGQGKTVEEVCKEIDVTDGTYYRWRKGFGGLKLDQAKRLKELEKENPLSQFRDFPGKHLEDEILAS